jgi:hypothetical protein
MPPHPHTYILFIGGLGGLVQWFGWGCSVWWDTAFEGGVSVPLVPDVPLVGEGIRTVLVGG